MFSHFLIHNELSSENWPTVYMVGHFPRRATDRFTQQITCLMNVVTSDWRTAIACPIFKKGDPRRRRQLPFNDDTNATPPSNLSPHPITRSLIFSHSHTQVYSIILPPFIKHKQLAHYYAVYFNIILIPIHICTACSNLTSFPPN